MIRRQLLLVNLIVMVLIVSVIVAVANDNIQKLNYNDSAFIYDMYIKEDYSNMNSVILDGQDYALTVSSNPIYQRQLADGLPEVTAMKDMISSLNYDNRIGHAEILPVVDYDGYKLEGNKWICFPEIMYDFDIKYGYKWVYRPDGLPLIRVSRLMRDASDNSKVIAIVNVDISLAEFEDRIYSYQADLNHNAEIYLLDENDHYLLHHYLKGYYQDSNDTVESLEKASYYYNGSELTISQNLTNGWRLVFKVDKTGLMGSSNTTASMTAIAIIIGLVGLLITYISTSRITRPILSLANNMKNTADKDDFTLLKSDSKNKGEIKVLYDSYNYLIDEVNASISKVQESTKKEADYQFRLLQAQINPHFLYNTLNIISFMAIEKRFEDIQKVVYSLVKLLRVSLNNGKQYVTFKDEIAHVCAYLDIMSYRYPDRYKVELDIDESTEDLLIVKQILQPLAENALTHGFLESGTNGVIKIVSRINGDNFEIEVHNSGTEIDLDYIHRVLSKDKELADKHYGIRNVNDRLVSRYGTKAGLNYYVENEDSVVSISIPLDSINSQGEMYE